MDGYKPTLKRLSDLRSGIKPSEEPTGKDAYKNTLSFLKSFSAPAAAEEKESIIKTSPVSKAAGSAKRSKSVFVTAARESVKLRKNVELAVKKILSVQKVLKDISKALKSPLSADAKITKINAIISAGGDAYKLAEAEQESKASLTSTLDSTATAVGNAGKGIAALILALPLLFSPEVRAFISQFFDGLLEGLGLGTEAIKIVKPVIGAVLGALGAVFTLKALSPVVTMFEKMKELADVLGLAGQAVGAEKEDVDNKSKKIEKEKQQIKKAGDKAKGDIKGTKKELNKNVKKLGPVARLKMLKNIIGPKLISLVKNFVKAIPFVGTVLGIGLILYELFDIGRDIFNFIKGEETPENEKQDIESTVQEEEKPSTSALEEPPSEKETKMADPAESALLASTSSESSSEGSMPQPEAASVTAPESVMASTTPEPAPSAPTGKIIEDLSVGLERKEEAMQETSNSIFAVVNNISNFISSSENKLSGQSLYSVSVGT